jgi:hypothetical protein
MEQLNDSLNILRDCWRLTSARALGMPELLHLLSELVPDVPSPSANCLCLKLEDLELPVTETAVFEPEAAGGQTGLDRGGGAIEVVPAMDVKLCFCLCHSSNSKNCHESP